MYVYHIDGQILVYLGTMLLHSTHFLQHSCPSTIVTNDAHWVHDRKYHSVHVSISQMVANTDPRHAHIS